MKKGIQESNSVLALWQRVILDGRLRKLAREFRQKLEIPIDGFNSLDEFSIWQKQIKDKNTEKKRDLNIDLFIQKSRKIIPYRGLFREIHFQVLVFKFLIYNKIGNEHLESINNSGMDIEIIKDSKIFYPKLKKYVGEISDGVYIKLKPLSTIDSILKYVESNKNLIRYCLKEYNKSVNLKKQKRFKISPHFERDLMILVANEWSKKEIEKNFNIKAKYKDQAISLLMQDMDFKRVTPQIVKAIKQRRKIK